MIAVMLMMGNHPVLPLSEISNPGRRAPRTNGQVLINGVRHADSPALSGGGPRFMPPFTTVARALTRRPGISAGCRTLRSGIGFYGHTDARTSAAHFLVTQYRRTKAIKPQFPNGVVSSVSFVSTTNTARSLAGCVSLALALTPWRSLGSSEKLCPAV